MSAYDHITDDTLCFHVPGRPGVIDYAIEVDGALVSQFSGRTLEELDKEWPGVEVNTLRNVCEWSENIYRHPPVEITEEKYFEMLGVLPPVGWRSDEQAESFKLSERTYGTITSIFCRFGDRYFCLSDSIHTPHDKIVAMVKAACEVQS